MFILSFLVSCDKCLHYIVCVSNYWHFQYSINNTFSPCTPSVVNFLNFPSWMATLLLMKFISENFMMLVNPHQRFVIVERSTSCESSASKDKTVNWSGIVRIG